jgi:uncharacterized protein YlxW (UPF0749 family)
MNDQEKKVIDDIKESKPMAWINGIFKQIKGKVVYYLIAGVFLVIGIWYYIATRPPKINQETIEKNEGLQKSVDSLLEKNKSLEQKNIELEKKVEEVNSKVDRNNYQIQRNLTELDKIKKQFNEKINAVDNYTSNDIDSFFTKRYN